MTVLYGRQWTIGLREPLVGGSNPSGPIHNDCGTEAQKADTSHSGLIRAEGPYVPESLRAHFRSLRGSQDNTEPRWHNLVLRKPGKLVSARISRFKSGPRRASILPYPITTNHNSRGTGPGMHKHSSCPGRGDFLFCLRAINI